MPHSRSFCKRIRHEQSFFSRHAMKLKSLGWACTNPVEITLVPTKVLPILSMYVYLGLLYQGHFPLPSSHFPPPTSLLRHHHVKYQTCHQRYPLKYCFSLLLSCLCPDSQLSGPSHANKPLFPFSFANDDQESFTGAGPCIMSRGLSLPS